MSLTAPTKVTVPFANSGAKNTIPVPSQIGVTSGAASFTDGFPPLTMLPIASGGIPPFGQDMNGILYDLSVYSQWQQAGGSFPFDGTFATAIGGYPQGAIVAHSDGTGFWVNTIANNTNDPENAATYTGWRTLSADNVLSITMTNANVTLTPLQASYPIIVITGVLTANINLVIPTRPTQFILANRCTGAFTITCKTAAGTGVATSPGSSQTLYCDGTNIVASQAFASNDYAVDTGSGNTFTMTFTPSINALVDGLRIRMRATHANTSGTVTVTVNGISATAYTASGASFVGNEINSGALVQWQYSSAVPGTASTPGWVLVQSAGGTTVHLGGLILDANAPAGAPGTLQVGATAAITGAATVGAPTAYTGVPQAWQMGAAGQCYLGYTSATVLTLSPYNGQTLLINGIPQLINNAGSYPTLSNSGLSASTFYYVYASMSGSNMVLTASTTAPTTSVGNNQGVSVMTGNNAQTLVGALQTNASSQFYDLSQNAVGVLSFFNRRLKTAQITVSGVTLTGGSFHEISSSARLNFISWGEDTVQLVSQLTGTASTTLVLSVENVVSGATIVGGVDATNVTSTTSVSGSLVTFFPAAGGTIYYFSPFGAASAGSVTSTVLYNHVTIRG